jgi:hypothetical protein
VLRSTRQRAGTDDVPVSRLRAGEVGVYELAELLSPSLFADERVVVLEAAGEAGKEAAELIANAAADIPSGTELVVVHSGGGRAKSLADQLRALGAQVYPCARITKAGERFDFVRKEFRSLKVKSDDDTVSALLDAVGSDIRELASACSQLVADTGGRVDVAAVRRYHGGRAEVKGFDIADKAVAGDVEGAVEALRTPCGVGRRVGRGRARHRPGRATFWRPLPVGRRSRDAALAGAESTEAGPALVPRHGGYRDEIGGDAERRREGRGRRCRLRAGSSGAKSRRARVG